MKEIKLKNGLLLELDENAMDNMELVDALEESSGDQDMLAVSKIVRIILGEEKRKILYDSLRTGDGRVPVAEVSNAVKEIFKSFGEKAKN